MPKKTYPPLPASWCLWLCLADRKRQWKLYINRMHAPTYIPESFFWKNQVNEPDKVAAACAVLNTLTKEQREAVDYLIQDRETETAWNNNAE